jgi:hypothetical protein
MFVYNVYSGYVITIEVVRGREGTDVVKTN